MNIPDMNFSMFPQPVYEGDCGTFHVESGLVIDLNQPIDEFMFSVSSSYDNFTGEGMGSMMRLDPKYDNERELYDVLMMEAFNMNGMPCVFHIISFDTQYDPLFGEDNDKRVVRSFPIMMYSPDTPDDNRIWTIFGTEGVNDLIFYISKEHFRVASSCGMTSDYPDGSTDHAMYPTAWTENFVNPVVQSGTTMNTGGVDNTAFSDVFQLGQPLMPHIPKVGDIMVLEYDNQVVFEIKRVREEEEMFLQHKHCWIVETTKIYVNEHINTNKTGAQPTNYISPELERLIETPEIYNDSDRAEEAKAYTNDVPSTFPDTTGKGKVNPFYNTQADETAPNDPFGGF